MSDASDTSPTVVDVYESCFGRSLERKDLSRSPLTPKDLSTFALALSDHYRTYRLPRKAVHDLRPSISPGFTTSRSVGLDYVFGARHFRGTFDYEFDPASQGEMTGHLKRYLLYCHGLVIQDPLPYLLDYFENGRTGETALARLPAVHALLSEYADLAELIKKRIVLPVSEPAIVLNDIPTLEEPTQKKLESRLPHLPSAAVRLLAHKVLEEQYRRRRFNDEVDLFFPHADYVLVLRELLKLTQEQFASTAITEPFGLAVLGSVSAVNPRALTTEDLVRIRADDELFAEWRAFLDRVFREIHSHEQSYTSLEAEYAVVVREELVLWRERFDARLQRGSMSHAWAESGTNISIGVVAGAVTGLIGGDATATLLGSLVGGALGGLVHPAIELLKNVVHTSVKKPDAMTLRHHFLALGLPEDEVPGRA